MSFVPQRVWITGGGGFIAPYLAREAARRVPTAQVRSWTRSELDLLDFAAVEQAHRRDTPDLILHCAALSRTGTCEADPALAHRNNVEVTRHLAALGALHPFFLFSTDLVFNGERGGYVETDPVNPVSVYAESKAAAEQVVLRNPAHAIVRISLTAGRSPSGRRAFNEEMQAAWREGRTLALFHDEYRCPLAAAVLARAVWDLVGASAQGLYHVAGHERLSRLEIGRLLAARWPEVTARIEPTSVRGFAGPRRAPDTSLDCTKAQQLISFPLPAFSSWLRDNPHEPI